MEVKLPDDKQVRHDCSTRPKSSRSFWRWPLGLLAVGVFAFLMAAVVSALCPFYPTVHDEFSNLLAADTLLQGRLSNATPDVWQPFQSFHIIVEPTYASKYPLGLALLVAAGWGLLGQPIAGCWLAAGICATSIAWMLAGMTSRRWALIGGLLIACYPPLQISWSQNLMSGWLPAAGSALLLGGIFRLRRRHSHWAAAMCGVGIAWLALTRPFEGLMATLALSGVCWGLWQRRSVAAKLQSIARAVPAAAIPIGAALTLICLHNLATTSRLDRMPYQLHEAQYAVTPVFVFGQPREPVRGTATDLPGTIRDFHNGWALDGFRERQGCSGWLSGISEVLWTLAHSVSVLVLLPLLTLGWWRGFRAARWLAAAIFLQVLLSASVCWIFLHYLAPLIPWLVALSVLGLRHVSRVFAKPSVGPRVRWAGFARPPRFVGYMLCAQCLLLVVHCIRDDNSSGAWARRRAGIVAELEQRDGQHLILVRYAADHNVHQEWVYNLANLDDAKVLWARGESDIWNARLIEKYQATHTIWELEADDAEGRIKLASVGTAAQVAVSTAVGASGSNAQASQKVQ